MTSPLVSRRRAYWLKTLHQWHWISAALSLAGLIVFAITGITLNNAAWIEASPTTTQVNAVMPQPLVTLLAETAESGANDRYKGPLPARAEHWLDQQFQIQIRGRTAEYSSDEVYVSLPEPGGDAWLAIDLGSGDVEFERTVRGWISYFNDLHKGRHTGVAWSWFIDIFAVACLIFAITGLFLLKLHAKNRPASWPMVGLGVAAPLILMLLFVH